MTRPDDGRWFAGVAAGLARRWDIDPVLIRGCFVALTVFGGVGIIFYGLAWLLLPQDDGRIHLQQAIRGDITAGFVGALILSLTAIGGGGSGPWNNGFWLGWAFPGGLIVTAAVVFGIWWMAKHDRGASTGETAWTAGTNTTTAPGSGSTPGTSTHGVPAYGSPSAATAYPPTYPPAGSAPSTWSSAEQQAAEATRQARKAATKAQSISEAEERTRVAKARRARTAPSRMIVRLSLGIALLLAAAIIVIGNANDWSEPVGLIATASALAVIAAGVIASGVNGRRAPGLAGIGLILAIGTLAGAAADNAGVRSGQHLTLVGQQTWEPHNTDAAEGQYNLGLGEATLWLTDPAILSTATPADPLDVRVRVGAGHLTVVVPDGTTTRIDLEVGAGDVSYPDGSTYRFDGDNGSFNDNERQRLTTGPAGSPRMIVDIQQGAGQLDIRTASDVSVTTIPSPSATNSSTKSPAAKSPAAKIPAAPSAPATPTAIATN